MTINAFISRYNTWRHPSDYDAQAKKLAGMFVENFKQYESKTTPEILAAAPNPN